MIAQATISYEPRPIQPQAATNTSIVRLGRESAFLERLRDREPQALERFYEAYFDGIYTYVRPLVLDDAEAEDVTQDVFLHVYGALPRYDPRRSLRPWVFTIAANRVRDHWRSRRVRKAQRIADVDDEAAQLSAEGEPPDAPAQRHERAEVLRAAICELAVGMRTVVLLRIYEELSFQTIAEMLGLSVPAARKRYSRALKSLRGKLRRSRAATLLGA